MNAALTLPTDTNQLAQRATAPSTRKAYGRYWARFVAWCSVEGRCSLPCSPETLGDYLCAAHAEGCAYNTLKTWTAAISVAHQAAGFDSPAHTLLVRKTLQGAARSGRPARKALALTVEALGTLVAATHHY